MLFVFLFQKVMIGLSVVKLKQVEKQVLCYLYDKRW